MVIESYYYAPFGSYLKDQFMSHVDTLTEKCKQLCMEEFLSAKTITYDVQMLDLSKVILVGGNSGVDK